MFSFFAFRFLWFVFVLFVLFSSSSLLSPFFPCFSLNHAQWTATRGPRWSPCTLHWWSASHAPPLRWAQHWRMLWGPLKTLCSLHPQESRMESPDQLHLQPILFCFFLPLFSFFFVFYKKRIVECVFWMPALSKSWHKKSSKQINAVVRPLRFFIFGIHNKDKRLHWTSQPITIMQPHLFLYHPTHWLHFLVNAGTQKGYSIAAELVSFSTAWWSCWNILNKEKDLFVDSLILKKQHLEKEHLDFCKHFEQWEFYASLSKSL